MKRADRSEAADLAKRLGDAVEAGSLTAPARLVRMLRAMERALRP